MLREFDGLYARVGRPSILPERLLRAQLPQIFYSVRSERLLMEQLVYNPVSRSSKPLRAAFHATRDAGFIGPAQQISDDHFLGSRR